MSRSLQADARFRPALILLGCILGLSVGMGPLLLVTFPVFMGPIGKSFGWSRGELAILFAFVNVAVVVASPIYGGLIRRFGAVLVIGVSAPLFMLALSAPLVLPGGRSVYVFCLVLAGFLGTGTHTFVYLSLVPQWFARRLGLIFGIAMLGVGLGQGLAPIAAQYLITQFGWQQAYAFLGMAAAVGAVSSCIFLLRTPIIGKTGEVADIAPSGMSASAAVRTTSFWLLATYFALISMVSAGCFVHFVAIAVDRQISAQRAAALLGSSGVAVALSRLIGGYLLDRLGAYYVAMFVGAIGVTSAISLAAPGTTATFLIAPFLLGCMLGIEGDVIPYITRRAYGSIDYPRIYSRFFAFYASGIVIGPLGMGLGYDWFGSYSPVLIIFAGCCGAAVGALTIAREAFRNSYSFDRTIIEPVA